MTDIVPRIHPPKCKCFKEKDDSYAITHKKKNMTSLSIDDVVSFLDKHTFEEPSPCSRIREDGFFAIVGTETMIKCIIESYKDLKKEGDMVKEMLCLNILEPKYDESIRMNGLVKSFFARMVKSYSSKLKDIYVLVTIEQYGTRKKHKEMCLPGGKAQLFEVNVKNKNVFFKIENSFECAKRELEEETGIILETNYISSSLPRKIVIFNSEVYIAHLTDESFDIKNNRLIIKGEEEEETDLYLEEFEYKAEKTDKNDTSLWKYPRDIKFVY